MQCGVAGFVNMRHTICELRGHRRAGVERYSIYLRPRAISRCPNATRGTTVFRHNPWLGDDVDDQLAIVHYAITIPIKLSKVDKPICSANLGEILNLRTAHSVPRFLIG
jgi:hypothetical protein